MSDLQCAARFLFLTSAGAATAESLRHERVAAVYDGARSPGAAELGLALSIPVEATARPISVDDVLAQAPDAVRRLRDLADVHRGETVVVVAAGEPGQRVEAALDADGLLVRDLSRKGPS